MIYNKLIVPFTRILSSREACMYTFKKELISYPKNTVKKEAKLLNDLKMWYHCEAKKQR